MPTYRNKSSGVEVEAIQWTGENHREILDLVGLQDSEVKVDLADMTIRFDEPDGVYVAHMKGDFIVKGEAGGFSNFPGGTFLVDYELVQKPQG